MGADLITANLWSKPDVTLDWEAGLRAARELSDESVQALHEQAGIYDEEWEDDDSPRLLAVTYVETVRDHFTGFTRDLNTFLTPDGRWRCWVTGGLSWGDSPSDLFDAVNDLYAVPEVLRAIGFEDGTLVKS